MRSRVRLAGNPGSTILLTFALGLGGSACGSERATAPTGLPSQRSAYEMQDIIILGPGTATSYLGGSPAYVVAPGETAQFRAIAKFADGTTQDVTSEATWQTANDNFLSLSGPGLFTGQKPGEVSISASRPPFSRYLSAHAVIVMAPDSYVLGGQVIESRDPLAVVNEAHLMVTSGPTAGQIAGTGFQGYRFYGLTGPTRIQVSKDGYRTQEITVTVTDHQLFDIDLPLLTPRADVSGTYNLLLSAAADCGVGLGDGQLPEEARERRYTAVVTQRGPELSVELSGGAFTEPMKSDRRISGRVEPRRVWFDLGWPEMYWDSGPPLLVEKLTTGQLLVVSGLAVTSVSDGRVAGTLAGEFLVYPAGSVPHAGVATAAHCYSEKHGFALSR